MGQGRGRGGNGVCCRGLGPAALGYALPMKSSNMAGCLELLYQEFDSADHVGRSGCDVLIC